jgi:hypothetical protein
VREPESTRDACRRKLAEWYAKHDQRRFNAMVERLSEAVQPRDLLVDTGDLDLLGQMGITW